MRNKLPVLGAPVRSGAVDPGLAYAELAINTYGAAEVWRLVDISDPDTTIPAQVSSARNGTLQGWTLQSGVSPIAGETLKTPLSDGANDYGNILTASLISLFNGQTGGVFGWSQVANVGVWTDATARFLFYIELNATNFIRVRKAASANILDFNYTANGTAKSIAKSLFNPTTSFSWALTWSLANDRVIAYVNGAALTPATGLGTWPAGNITIAQIGANDTVPNRVFNGYQSYIMFFGAEPSGATIAALHAGVG